jgi:hypothetical protein
MHDRCSVAGADDMLVNFWPRHCNHGATLRSYIKPSEVRELIGSMILAFAWRSILPTSMGAREDMDSSCMTQT